MAEILYLSQEKKIQTSLDEVHKLIRQNKNIKECHLGLKVSQKAAEITDVPKLHDRLIGATARYLEIPLLSNDPLLQASLFLETIW